MVKKNIVGQVILNIIFIFLAVAALAPFLLLVSSSLTSEATLAKYGYNFYPRDFTLAAYEYIFKSSKLIFRAYAITIIVTAVGTTISVLTTVLFAYPLSRKELPGRMVVSFILFFTMLFNGGLVPSYIMWTQMFHIKNTYFALLIPSLLMSAFYVIMMRSYFTANIPNEIIEAARVDGAREFMVLFRIVLPLSKPMIATIALMIGLRYWNDWTNSLYYITDADKFSVQAVLNTMLNNINFLAQNPDVIADSSMMKELPSTAVRMGVAVVGVLPILAAYPFFQKHFVKGIVVGGIKG
ncbi:MAG: carbohydrate ABC transporter permease [Lachnospiraceae bacterium]|jgi:putative aldouronate transport system permease protein|nr:carbohydrate ABC transporter permease [Lachnospiraceae bacterium]